MRHAEDTAFQKMLERVRNGVASDEDIKQLGQRQLDKLQLSSQQLEQMTFIVERNALRSLINLRYLQHYSSVVKRPLQFLLATDKLRDTGADAALWIPLLRSLPDNQTENLMGKLPVVIGMQVLIKDNLFTELGIANGTQGTLLDMLYTTPSDRTRFLLDSLPTAVVQISTPPGVILPALHGYPDGAILISPVTKACSAMLNIPGRVDQVKVAFSRTQLPMIPAKALTVHAAQGKTLDFACVDVVPPPGAKDHASLLYVALSRVRRIQDLAVLRPFTASDIRWQPAPDLIAEIRRLRDKAAAVK